MPVESMVMKGKHGFHVLPLSNLGRYASTSFTSGACNQVMHDSITFTLGRWQGIQGGVCFTIRLRSSQAI